MLLSYAHYASAYSSVGRVPVSKTVSPGFESRCACQNNERDAKMVSRSFTSHTRSTPTRVGNTLDQHVNTTIKLALCLFWGHSGFESPSFPLCINCAPNRVDMANHITFSTAGAERARALLASHGVDAAVRVFVKSGGCSQLFALYDNAIIGCHCAAAA